MQISPQTPSDFWAMIGAVAAACTVIGGVIVFLYSRLRAATRREFEPISEENKRLRAELEDRLRLPNYVKDVVQLTEAAADRKIEDLHRQLAEARKADDNKEAEAVSAEIDELERMREQLNRAARERDALQQQLQGALFARPASHGDNAVGLPTGPILLVKHAGRYGAIKAIDQASDKRGKFIKYAWWYQPRDDQTNFLTADTLAGVAETREGIRGRSPQIMIGPISLEWSMGGDGFGWVYYGPSSTPSPGYEFAMTNEVDITRVDVRRYSFNAAPQLRFPSSHFS